MIVIKIIFYFLLFYYISKLIMTRILPRLLPWFAQKALNRLHRQMQQNMQDHPAGSRPNNRKGASRWSQSAPRSGVFTYTYVVRPDQGAGQATSTEKEEPTMIEICRVCKQDKRQCDH